MTNRRWEDARRLEAWAGEVRVNVIRAAALVAFYINHLIHVYVRSHNESLQGMHHLLVTAVVPLLRRRALRPEGYAGRTLREHLQLARPVSRFAA